MKKFFCYGKKDFCENTDLCIECPHFATADVAPVMHGRWEVYFDGKELMCSSCKATFWDEEQNRGSNYCPNCGAKMDGGADHEDD